MCKKKKKKNQKLIKAEEKSFAETEGIKGNWVMGHLLKIFRIYLLWGPLLIVWPFKGFVLFF